MQCLRRTQHQHGKMAVYAIGVALNSHLRNENTIVAIADKSFVHNVRAKLVHCRNLASKRRFVYNEFRLNRATHRMHAVQQQWLALIGWFV